MQRCKYYLLIILVKLKFRHFKIAFKPKVNIKNIKLSLIIKKKDYLIMEISKNGKSLKFSNSHLFR